MIFTYTLFILSYFLNINNIFSIFYFWTHRRHKQRSEKLAEYLEKYKNKEDHLSGFTGNLRLMKRDMLKTIKILVECM